MKALRFDINYGTGYVTSPPPKNWKELKLQLMFDQSPIQAQLQATVLEWVNKNADKNVTYKNQGLIGGTGIFEGPGLKIFAGTAAINIFEGCLNTADPDYKVETGVVVSPIKESGRTDWFNDIARSFTFEYLTSDDYLLAPNYNPAARITSADYKRTPYCINTIPNYTQAAMLSISLFIVIKEAVDVICKIESLIARMIGQGMSWFQLIMTILELIIYVIYLVAIIFASARLMQDLLDNIIQPKKTKLCMREADLFIKGCAYLNLQYSSSIHGVNAPLGYNGRYKDITIMPKKILKPKGDVNIFEEYFRPPDETSAADSYGYYDDGDGTFADYVEKMELTYHAKAIVKNGFLYFEEENKFNFNAPFVMPNEGVVGKTFNYPQPYSTNAANIPIVYSLRFLKDDQDLNTINDYTGTYAVAITKPLVVIDQKNLLFNNAKVVQIPFAHARRKQSLSKLEQRLLETLNDFNRYVNDVFRLHNKVNDWLNTDAPGGVSDANGQVSNADLVAMFTGSNWIQVAQIDFGSGNLPNIPPYSFGFSDDRHGWMLLSSDFIGVPKRFRGMQVGDDWYIDPLNQDSSVVSTIDVSSINGTFTGHGIGMITGTFVGSVVNGFVTGNVSAIAGGLGTAAGMIVGTISGYPGTTWQISVSGSVSGGVLPVAGFVSPSITGSTAISGYGSAIGLMNDFHYTELINENQWLVFKNKKIRFTERDFVQVNNNNTFVTADGRKGKFDRVLWDMHNDTAECDYRIKEKYTNNYKLTISSDGG